MPGPDPSVLLEPAHAPLDDIATPIGLPVETRIPPLILAGRDHRLDTPAAQVTADARVAVTLVAGQPPRPAASPAPPRPRQSHRLQHRLQVLRIVGLTGRERGRQGQAPAIDDPVQLGPEAAPAAAQGVVGRLARHLHAAQGSGRRAAGSDRGGVDAPEVVVEAAALVELQVQPVQDAVDHALAPPAAEAVVDALPLPIAPGQLAPLGAGVEDPEDAVERRPVVIPLPPGLARGGQQILDLGELRVGQLIAAGHGGEAPQSAAIVYI